MKNTLKIMSLLLIAGVMTFAGCKKKVEKPSVTTIEVTEVTANSAISGGAVTNDGGGDITARGVCWSVNIDPTLSDHHTTEAGKMGNFTSTLTNLIESTTYYVRAYATNSAGTTYGNQKEFTTLAGGTNDDPTLPQVTTADITDITATGAMSGGSATAEAENAITARGICWSTNANPTIADSHTTDGEGNGDFVSQLTNLTDNTTYYVRAYATNASGTAYGSQKTFTTLAISGDATLPEVTTDGITNITTTSATCGGNVTNDGGATVTARGICWSTELDPTTADSHTSDGTGTGEFISEMTNLTDNTTYYVRAYATNAIGTTYGPQKTFTTEKEAQPHYFSVGATQKVIFSSGNLQYQKSTDTWRFAPNQWEVIGEQNQFIGGSTYTGWIDLFGWGTSGWNSGNTYYRPWDKEHSGDIAAEYGPIGNFNLTDVYANCDWGVYNQIDNYPAGTWRVLTREEWSWLLTARPGAEYLAVQATVNGTYGLLVLPDDWVAPTGLGVIPGAGNYTTNSYDSFEWLLMEDAGAVFLPAAGRRTGSTVEGQNTGGYWSSNYSNLFGTPTDAYYLFFNFQDFGTDCHYRSIGRSVRLVR